jgi:hypothetical protein
MDFLQHILLSSREAAGARGKMSIIIFPFERFMSLKRAGQGEKQTLLRVFDMMGE